MFQDLPRLLAVNRSTGQAAINVLLSQDETYSDLAPVRLSKVRSSIQFLKILGTLYEKKHFLKIYVIYVVLLHLICNVYINM